MRKTERNLVGNKFRLPALSGRQLLANNQLFDAFFTQSIIDSNSSFIPWSPLVDATVTASSDQLTGKLQGPATMEGVYVVESFYDEDGEKLPEGTARIFHARFSS